MSSESSTRGNLPGRFAEPFLYTPVNAENSNLTPNASVVPWAGSPTDAGIANTTSIEQRAYDKGLADGEARARAGFEKALAEVRSQISVALREFTTQRENYFEGVEAEVVQLALSIARKILHRETQMDPLLLTGVVRVALESLNDGTRICLRTNPEEIRFWRDYFGQAHDISPTPELVGDASLASGHCVLETNVGSTHISFDTQLKEIEQGFLDLLEQRPRVQE